MLTRFAYRINTVLERYFPEQRLFLKSETETRFIRLRPATQALAVVFGSLALAWTILATAILLMDSISAGTSREQVARQQALRERHHHRTFGRAAAGLHARAVGHSHVVD